MSAPVASAAVAGTPRVTIVALPRDVTVFDLAGIPGMSVGLMSAGIGQVPPAQTYLDISQGNRINRSLYGSGTPTPHVEAASPGVQRVDPKAWRAIVDRATVAPAELTPGLLASTLQQAGVPVRAGHATGSERLIAADRSGRVRVDPACAAGCPGLAVTRGTLADAAKIARRLKADDMLVAFSKPPAAKDHELAIGIAGSGYQGQLTSESTHTDGLVLSTDIAPTVIDRFGVAVPGEVVGQMITSSGEPDTAAIADLEQRLSEVGPRRHTVIGVNLMIWAALALLGAIVGRRRGLRKVIPILAVTLVFAPALMLVAPAFDPSELAERLIVGAGAPALALLSVTLLGPWRALALGAAVSVGGYAVDVVTGSYLTTRSVMGPNPSLGVRFYGIGNELEAMVAALSALGTGAALQAWIPRIDRRRAAAVFAVVGLAAVIAFAPGRFGADVGAAIDVPVGAAVGVAVCLGATRGRALLILLVPFAALAALAVIDLVTGGDSHLTRSVLQAGGLNSLGDVAERRLRLSAMSFSRYLDNPAFWTTIALVILGVAKRRTIRSWFSGANYAWAGFAGAVAATLVGTVANDSGALLMMIGTTYVALGAGVAWSLHDAQAGSGAGPDPPVP
jgi:hypothetical protein